MTYCQTTTTATTRPDFIYNCSFLNNTYLTYSAVSDQFQFINQTSVSLTASYAFTLSTTFELGLIYQFSPSNYLVPFPVIFNCASIVHSCQLKTITGTTVSTRDSEPIRVELTSFNYTKTTTSSQFNQMSLYLKQGRYQLSNCSLNNDQQMTDPKTIFYIQIDYEKSVGTPCDSMSTTCGSPSLTTCSSSKCACISSASSVVSYSDSLYCADMLNTSNCHIFPSRCIMWCNQTINYLCICPSDTLKIQRNNIFICELPVNSDNCSIDDNIRRCSLGQCCLNGQCMDCSLATSTTTLKTININDSTIDERLRIALSVIAGLLGTSVLILLVAFYWLRRKQKLCRLTAEKSLESSSSSSLYISPVQQKQQQEKYFSSTSPIYQLSYNDEKTSKPFYRADSFRQAVRFGHKEKQIIEHVSTKRNSFINEKDGWSSPTFSTLEYVIPTITDENMNNNNNNNNTYTYQTIIPSSPVLTHAV
ncbi:unnamed protein product [Adineta steineri]|uniref:Uncharacterized protein n=1 Tax=Adineta steineri TaxID=433720 RepID=A0A813REJ1_9BILA|nr:unnamed protein product [Adineta steineri]